MINFVIVDDNSLHRKKINKIIFSKMMENKIDFKIHEFNDYNSSLLKYIKEDKKDTIYVLDLELPNGTYMRSTNEIEDKEIIDDFIAEHPDYEYDWALKKWIKKQ